MELIGLMLPLLVLLQNVMAQTIILDNIDKNRPCEHPNSIQMPKDKKCLIPVKDATTWYDALKSCESFGGSLYETPDARLPSRPELLGCLSAMTDFRYDDMWLNALGMWSPHFFWINGTLLNKVDYCTLQRPSLESDVPIKSDTLGVDYCVSQCHERGSRYIIFKKNPSPECYCKKELAATYKLPCPTTTVDYNNDQAYYIVHSKEDSLIRISPADGYTRNEILCSTVSTHTLVNREMNSGTCFTRNPFVCCLGEADKCVNTNCYGNECRFIMRDKCMLRVALSYTWYAARAYCVNLGGDLWNMHEFNELTQVNQYLVDGSTYWIGATNYGWTFNGTSPDFRHLPFNDTVRVRCGHMFRELETATSRTWQWSDAQCNIAKSYLCQFNKTSFNTSEQSLEVICPWAYIPSTTLLPPPISIQPTLGNGSQGSTGNLSGFPSTESFVNEQSADGESFPIAAVIAAIIAGLIMVTCLGLAATWCARSPWCAGGMRKVRERLAFIPYFANMPMAAIDYEGHAAMSSVSDHGSQVGLMKGEYQAGASGYQHLSSSYTEQSGMFSSRTMESHQQEAISAGGAAGMSAGALAAASQGYRGQGYGAGGSYSADAAGFMAGNTSMSSSARDYMTLQAQMNILDDAEVAGLRDSFRRKPEVSLVTDSGDLNFTVNHAVSQGQRVVGASDLSRSSTEQAIEGVILPTTDGGAILTLPERVVEEARIFSTLKTTYNV